MTQLEQTVQISYVHQEAHRRNNRRKKCARERAIEYIEDAIMSWRFNHEMTHALRKSQNLAYTLASI